MSAATSWTIAGVRAALEAKKISARELAAEFYARIDSRNAELNAFLTLSPERAYAQADRIDAAIGRGETLPPLAGVPIAIKDVLSTRGIRTTCASKILESYVPPYDATAVERLEARAPSSWAKRTATNSRWAARMRTPPTARCEIRSRSIVFPADQVEALLRPSRPVSR